MQRYFSIIYYLCATILTVFVAYWQNQTMFWIKWEFINNLNYLQLKLNI